MRFHIGAIPEDQEFLPEAQGWRGIREPNPIWLNLFAIPVVIALMIVWALMIFFILVLRGLPPIPPTSSSLTLNPALLILILVLLIPAHEFLHALFYPDWGLSSRTIIGVWLSKGVFYAHYEGKMGRNRFLLIFLTPYLVLGILPALVWALLPANHLFSEVSINLLYISLLGSIFSSSDLVGVSLVFLQIPAAAIVRNKGWKTYWKPEMSDPVRSPDKLHA